MPIAPSIRGFVAVVAGLGAPNLAGASPPHGGGTTAFTHGHWFNGAAFEESAFYVVDGTFTRKPPERLDSTVDLGGRWVIPPFGEAHNHNISRPPLEREIARYRDDGIFYVMIQNNLVPDGAAREPVAGAVDVDVDVVYANGGLTASGGHVVALHEGVLAHGGLAGLTKQDLDGRAFFVTDSVADLDAKWAAVVRGKPDFLKVFMGFSEEIEKRRTDPRYFAKRGLDLGVVADAVRRAHAASLRVSAHIETAADFREAIRAGVDIVAHLPGWRLGADAGFDDPSPTIDRWLLRDDDAKLAAARKTTVVTTVLAGKGVVNPKDPLYETYRRLHSANLTKLMEHKVELAIGSDYYEGTSVAEALLLGKQPLLQGVAPLGVFDNAALLRAWCEATPRAIFPGRKIGRLEEGYEASFLVLEGDPIADFGNVRKIWKRVKGGRILG